MREKDAVECFRQYFRLSRKLERRIKKLRESGEKEELIKALQEWRTLQQDRLDAHMLGDTFLSVINSHEFMQKLLINRLEEKEAEIRRLKEAIGKLEASYW